MTVVINGTSGITAPEVTLDNSSADGGQVVLKSSGSSNWNLDNYNGTFRAYYNATENFKIDTNGYVTTPNQPMFRAKCSGGANATTSPIPFTLTDFNISGSYSTSTYRFTAPIAGKYFLTAKTYIQPAAATYANTGLYLNGNVFAYVEMGNNSMQLSLTISEVMNLSAGDYVTVSFSSNGKQYYQGGSETSFSGFLVG